MGSKSQASAPEGVTALLQEWTNGDAESLQRLIPLVYDQLKQKARYHLLNESNAHTLQPTALINEVYLRLKDGGNMRFTSRLQFFSFAGQLMMRILVEHARARMAQKRGGDQEKVSLDIDGGDNMAGHWADPVMMLALNESLEKLEQIDDRKSKVLSLSLFAGLKAEEIAELMEVSAVTIRRELRAARCWVAYELKGADK
ncbi:MAG: ECF-type sigma factor [Acidobacteriota bacterium]|nr:ECF-type sigma factor [Acidobacteriota bacterium]